ncbi:hypothetical protein ERW51_11880, partial [Aliivibrio finisterrensis]
GFLQTPPLASDALAIQIVFPLVGVTLLSCKQTGLPALLGKQKRELITSSLLYKNKKSDNAHSHKFSVIFFGLNNHLAKGTFV